jgi:hypothetical protein
MVAIRGLEGGGIVRLHSLAGRRWIPVALPLAFRAFPLFLGTVLAALGAVAPVAVGTFMRDHGDAFPERIRVGTAAPPVQDLVLGLAGAGWAALLTLHIRFRVIRDC